MNFSRLSSAINSLLAASKRCNATAPGWYCGRSHPVEYYNDTTREIVAQRFAPDIARFGLYSR